MTGLLLGLLLCALCCRSSEVRDSSALDEPAVFLYDNMTEAYYYEYNESLDYYHYEGFPHDDRDPELIFDQASGTIECSSILLLSMVLPLMVTC